jgi:hypothetical protein
MLTSTASTGSLVASGLDLELAHHVIAGGQNLSRVQAARS